MRVECAIIRVEHVVTNKLGYLYTLASKRVTGEHVAVKEVMNT